MDDNLGGLVGDFNLLRSLNHMSYGTIAGQSRGL